MTQEKDIYERLMWFKWWKYERWDKVIVIKNPSEIQSYLRYKKWDVFEVSCHWIGMTFTKENILLFDEHIELLSKFVELPTTDTGKDWIDEAYTEFWRNVKFWLNLEHEEQFRYAVEKFMPKPVKPVLLDEVVNQILSVFNIVQVVWDSKYSLMLKHILAPYITGKQEQLVPLDVKKIIKDYVEHVKSCFVWKVWEELPMNTKVLENILSKCWVYTQEEAYEIVDDETIILKPHSNEKPWLRDRLFKDINWEKPLTVAESSPNNNIFDKSKSDICKHEFKTDYPMWWKCTKCGLMTQDKELFINKPLNHPVTSTIEELADRIDNMIDTYSDYEVPPRSSFEFNEWDCKDFSDKADKELESIKELLSMLPNNTTTIDELVEKIEQIIIDYHALYGSLWIDDCKKEVRRLLSSLSPIGKKLTKSNVSERLVKSWRVSHNEEENKWLQVLRDFLEEKHLLQE
jgi:hypothetical protein